jgi:hypothetical protein
MVSLILPLILLPVPSSLRPERIWISPWTCCTLPLTLSLTESSDLMMRRIRYLLENEINIGLEDGMKFQSSFKPSYVIPAYAGIYINIFMDPGSSPGLDSRRD